LPYCPGCGFIFPREVDVCPDCEVTLVEELPGAVAPAVAPDDSWVVVGGVAGEVKAKVARGSLNSNNIPSVFLPSPFEAEAQLDMANVDKALLGVRADLILVPREFGNEARLILLAVLGEELIQPVVDNPLI